MSIDGHFIEEEADIVRLVTDDPTSYRGGWVNVGPHAVFIQMSSDGTLTVEAYPCQNEAKALAKLEVTREQALAAGGKDCEE